MTNSHGLKSEVSKYKVGDEVWFEEVWEDITGAYHDECAKILAIEKDGKLKLDWFDVPQSVKEALEEDEHYLEDISYLNEPKQDFIEQGRDLRGATTGK